MPTVASNNRMKNVLPVNNKYHQGAYNPINEHKYVGEKDKIYFRSSLEYNFMVKCDNNPNIKKWSSEPFEIPYLSPLDNKTHFYYVDFWILVENDEGIEKRYLIEIKPKSHLKKPEIKQRVRPKKSYDNYMNNMKNYIINITKWRAAQDFCKQNNMEFRIITEDFLKKVKK